MLKVDSKAACLAARTVDHSAENLVANLAGLKVALKAVWLGGKMAELMAG